MGRFWFSVSTVRLEYFDEDPEVKSLLDRVLDYRELLSCVRQNDYKISGGSTRNLTTMLMILWSLVKVVITGILMVPGFLLALPSLVIILAFCAKRGATVTFLDYVALINIFPWLFYLTIYLGGI